MRILNILESVVAGATLGVTAITALPLFGAVGVITTTGVVVGSTVGAAAALFDKFTDDD